MRDGFDGIRLQQSSTFSSPLEVLDRIGDVVKLVQRYRCFHGLIKLAYISQHILHKALSSLLGPSEQRDSLEDTNDPGYARAFSLCRDDICAIVDVFFWICGSDCMALSLLSLMFSPYSNYLSFVGELCRVFCRNLVETAAV
jgi:hypothetical protein